MTVHKLKTWPWFFQATIEGRKLFELRRNDREFRVGDFVELVEYAPTHEPPETGRRAKFRITFLLNRANEPGKTGIAPGFVVFGIEPVTESEFKYTFTSGRWIKEGR